MAVVTTSRASMCGPLIREETKKKKKSQDPSQKDKKPQTGQSYFGVQTQTLTHSHTHTLTHSHTSSLFGGKQDQSFNRPATDRCRQNTPIISSSLRAAKRQKKNKQKQTKNSSDINVSSVRDRHTENERELLYWPPVIESATSFPTPRGS